MLASHVTGRRWWTGGGGVWASWVLSTEYWMLKAFDDAGPPHPEWSHASCDRNYVTHLQRKAVTGHLDNSDFSRVCLLMFYESLSPPKPSATADETTGFLLSLNLFTSNCGAQGDDLKVWLADFQPRLGTIHHPEVILILWDLAFRDTTSMWYGMFKLFKELLYVSHRNQGDLSGLGLVKSAFMHFIMKRGDESVSEEECRVLQKVSRRLLDMGVMTSEVRRIFQQAVKGWFGMKSRWLQHFSMRVSQPGLFICQLLWKLAAFNGHHAPRLRRLDITLLNALTILL